MLRLLLDLTGARDVDRSGRVPDPLPVADRHEAAGMHRLDGQELDAQP